MVKMINVMKKKKIKYKWILNVNVIDFNLFFIYNIFKIFVFQNKKIICYFFLYFFFKFYFFFIMYMEEKLLYFFMFWGVGLDKKNF